MSYPQPAYGPQSYMSVPPTSEGMSTGKKLAIVGAVSVVILLIFIIGWVVYDYSKSSSTGSGTSTPATVVTGSSYVPPTYNTNEGYDIIYNLMSTNPAPYTSSGGVIFGGTVASESACQSICGSSPTCVGYQYIGPGVPTYGNSCYLLDNGTTIVGNQQATGYSAGTINSPIPSSLMRTPNVSRTYGYAGVGQSNNSNIKYYGSTSNEVSCANTCAQDSFCQAYEWYDPSIEKPWALGCYGVSTGWTNNSQTGTYSGLLS
jgi:hypothetical protein